MVESVAKSVQFKPGKLLIDGKWVEASSGKTLDTINPATEEVLTTIAAGGPQDVNLAVEAARRAFEDGPWSSIHPSARGKLLYKLAQLVSDNAEELATIDTMDMGKPIRETLRWDLPAVIDCLEYYAGWADKRLEETVEVGQAGDKAYARREEEPAIYEVEAEALKSAREAVNKLK